MFIRDAGDDTSNDKKTFDTESLDINEYFGRRTDSYASELYAILIWRIEEEPSQRFLEEIEKAFDGKEIQLFTFDVTELDDSQYTLVMDDLKKLMKLSQFPMIPTIVIMRGGESVFEHQGLMFKEEVLEKLQELGIE